MWTFEAFFWHTVCCLPVLQRSVGLFCSSVCLRAPAFALAAHPGDMMRRGEKQSQAHKTVLSLKPTGQDMRKAERGSIELKKGKQQATSNQINYSPQFNYTQGAGAFFGWVWFDVFAGSLTLRALSRLAVPGIHVLS